MSGAMPRSLCVFTLTITITHNEGSYFYFIVGEKEAMEKYPYASFLPGVLVQSYGSLNHLSMYRFTFDFVLT